MPKSKVCPFCAEDIKKAAIVCKHCGRELPGYKNNLEILNENEYIPAEQIPQKLSEPEYKKKPIQKSVKFAIIATVIGWIMNFSNSYNPITKEFPSERIGNMIISLPILFLFWLIIGAIVVWIYRKIGKKNIKIIGGVLFIFVIAFIGYLYLKENKSITETKIIQVTPIPSKLTAVERRQTELAKIIIQQATQTDCIHFSKIDSSYLNQTFCIFGVITDHIYYENTTAEQFVLKNDYPNYVEFRFGFSSEVDSENLTGNCVEIRGKLIYQGYSYQTMFTMYPREYSKFSNICD
jgi:hypothetical protein